MVLSVMISSAAISVRETEQQPRERADFATGQATVRKFASPCERKSVAVACELLYLDFASEWLVTGMESRLG